MVVRFSPEGLTTDQYEAVQHRLERSGALASRRARVPRLFRRKRSAKSQRDMELERAIRSVRTEPDANPRRRRDQPLRSAGAPGDLQPRAVLSRSTTRRVALARRDGQRTRSRGVSLPPRQRPGSRGEVARSRRSAPNPNRAVAPATGSGRYG